MGCFSFMCKECDEAILSNSFRGQEVELFLLEDGKVIQHMSGEYDSYGSVFIDGTQHPGVKHKLRESVQWNPLNLPVKDKWDDNGTDNWHRVCDLMFGGSNDGIAAVHSKCYKGNIPTTPSEDDPNQGWGEEGKLLNDFEDKEIL